MSKQMIVWSLVPVVVSLGLSGCKGDAKAKPVEGTFEGTNVVVEKVVSITHSKIPSPNMKAKVTITASNVTVDVRDAENRVEFRCEAPVTRTGNVLAAAKETGKCSHMPEDESKSCYSPKLGALQIDGLDATKKLDLIILPGEYSSRCAETTPDESVNVTATL
jgi:hypothetical protein